MALTPYLCYTVVRSRRGDKYKFFSSWFGSIELSDTPLSKYLWGCNYNGIKGLLQTDYFNLTVIGSVFKSTFYGIVRFI